MIRGIRVPVLSAAFLAAVLFPGCFTEIGNPGKENQVTATFSIDYTEAAVPKRGASLPPSAPPPAAIPAVTILQFYFNVVEANYDYRNEAGDSAQGRLWKKPDSAGDAVDFTGKDKDAVLDPVTVPAGNWFRMKLESRIPPHETLVPDTLDFAAFSNRGYIKGTYARDGRTVHFLCQLPEVGKINLVYDQAILGQWRHGSSYDLEFIFFARKWVSGVDLLEAETVTDRSGLPVAIIDQDNNGSFYERLCGNDSGSFYKSFNSLKVWKEN